MAGNRRNRVRDHAVLYLRQLILFCPITLHSPTLRTYLNTGFIPYNCFTRQSIYFPLSAGYLLSLIFYPSGRSSSSLCRVSFISCPLSFRQIICFPLPIIFYQCLNLLASIQLQPKSYNTANRRGFVSRPPIFSYKYAPLPSHAQHPFS